MIIVLKGVPAHMFEVTIPVLNEEVLLEKNIHTLEHFLLVKFPQNAWNIVIADNGSSDQTQLIGKRLAAEKERITYLRLEEKGVGLALQTSWLASDADIVGYMDLDLATDLAHLQDALEALHSKTDLVYGSRLHAKAIVKGRSLYRSLTSRCFNTILHQYLGAQFSDGMCGFKFLKKTAFEKLYACGVNNKGWFFSTELLVMAEWLGLQLHELPIRWTDSGDSHVRVLPLALRYLDDMRRLKKLRSGILPSVHKS